MMGYRLFVSFQEQEFILIFYDYQGPLGMSTLGKGIYSQLGNMHWKVDEHLKYLINFSKRKYSLEI